MSSLALKHRSGTMAGRHERRQAGFDFGLDAAPDPRRAALEEAARAGEQRLVQRLIPIARLSKQALAKTQALAAAIAASVRAKRKDAAGVDALMAEFSLDSREGVALMCL